MNEQKKTDISIIIPLYKGKKYQSRLIEMINDNLFYKDFYRKCAVEVVFVNDYPAEKIDIVHNACACEIVVVEHSENKGIHAARVTGIKESRGNYIIMLDQDDFVKRDWLYSQWISCNTMRADFCVCNGWISRFKTLWIYDNFAKRVNDLESYLIMGNAIVSPGQVIIKKQSIPQEWLDNTQVYNGADDFLLWVIVLKKGYIFSINRDYLYLHTPERTNDSIGIEKMILSLKETKCILESIGVLDAKECSVLQEQIDRREEIERGNIFPWGNKPEVSAREYKRIKTISEIFQKWIKLKNQGIHISRYLEERNIKEIAIYGIGEIGENLYRELMVSDIKVLYGIDRNAKDFMDELRIFKIGDDLQPVDAVIVAMRSLNTEKRTLLKEKIGCEIIMFPEILDTLEEYII